jgi:hypothetical protein
MKKPRFFLDTQVNKLVVHELRRKHAKDLVIDSL